MPVSSRDDALSEVVGFVLLLALIVVALSLYQVYGVPAAGRENEIAHMNQVKDRFVDYKIALDSLWLNDREGVLLSTAFDLGTGAATTAGSALSFPILSPAGSGGTLVVKSGGANLTIKRYPATTRPAARKPLLHLIKPLLGGPDLDIPDGWGLPHPGGEYDGASRAVYCGGEDGGRECHPNRSHDQTRGFGRP